MNVIIDGVRYVPAPMACENPALLDVTFQCDDLNREISIREYLGELLSTMWAEGEGFSSKRPFGNSGWEFDLYRALVKCGAVEGSFFEDGGLDEYDRDAADKIVFGLIDEMCKAA